MAIDDVFAVIAETTRREILTSLRSGDKAVGELVHELGVSQPTVSKHLKVLRESGLVTMRAQGQKRFYSLRAEPLRDVVTWLNGFESAVAEEPEPVAAAGAMEVGVTEQVVIYDGEQRRPQQLQRTVERAAGRAADIFANLPGFRKKRD